MNFYYQILVFKMVFWGLIYIPSYNQTHSYEHFKLLFAEIMARFHDVKNAFFKRRKCMRFTQRCDIPACNKHTTNICKKMPNLLEIDWICMEQREKCSFFKRKTRMINETYICVCYWYFHANVWNASICRLQKWFDSFDSMEFHERIDVIPFVYNFIEFFFKLCTFWYW